jgi:hypothetical protein
VGKPEGKRLPERLLYRWEDNSEMALIDIRWGGMDWIYVDQ